MGRTGSRGTAGAYHVDCRMYATLSAVRRLASCDHPIDLTDKRVNINRAQKRLKDRNPEAGQAGQIRHACFGGVRPAFRRETNSVCTPGCNGRIRRSDSNHRYGASERDILIRNAFIVIVVCICFVLPVALRNSQLQQVSEIDIWVFPPVSVPGMRVNHPL